MKKSTLINLLMNQINNKIGGFAGTFDLGLENQLLLATTDGVGTKLTLAKWHDDFSGIGQDLVAMNVNDLVTHGGKPLFFLDYYACSFIDTDRMKIIIDEIIKACESVDCKLIGGETAEMPYTYNQGDLDLAGFAVGIVDKKKHLPKININPSNVILGLESSGGHSNGFSKIIDRCKGYMQMKELLTPTKIYVNQCLSVLGQTDAIKGLSHITGGGLLENIPRVLMKGLNFRLGKWTWPSVFWWVKESGNFTEQEMLETFNCGIGMAVIVSKRRVKEVADLFEKEGEIVHEIGVVTEE